jgi:serine protease Do
MARVKFTQNAGAVLDPTLKTEFDAWLKNNNNFGGRGGPRRDQNRDPAESRRGDGPRPEGMGRGGPGGGPGGGGPYGSDVPRFLRSKANELSASNPDESARLSALALRAELAARAGLQGEFSTILLNTDGYALVVAGLLREAHKGNIPITLPDGSETTAAFVGAALPYGFTVIKLDRTTGLKPVNLSRRRLMPGEMLVSITAGPNSAAFVMASGKPGAVVDDRFMVPSDRSGAFLFDTNAEIAAIVPGGIGGGWAGDRQAVPISRITRSIDYIIKNGKDLEPRPLGIRYDRIDRALPAPRASSVLATLAGQHAVAVVGVDKGSLAAKAGIVPGDVIVTLDGRPWQEVLQVQTDLVTRTGTVPITVIRADKDKEELIQMPLD